MEKLNKNSETGWSKESVDDINDEEALLFAAIFKEQEKKDVILGCKMTRSSQKKTKSVMLRYVVYCFQLYVFYYVARHMPVWKVTIPEPTIPAEPELRYSLRSDVRFFEKEERACDYNSEIFVGLTDFEGQSPHNKFEGVEKLATNRSGILFGEYELPICILTHSTSPYKNLIPSIHAQNYTNKKVMILDEQCMGTYYECIQDTLERECMDEHAVVMIAYRPLAASALNIINDLHQLHHTYLTYSPNGDNGEGEGSAFEVFSFYRRLLNLVKKNDFKGHNKRYYETGKETVKNQNGILTLSLLELSQYHKKNIDPTLVLESESTNPPQTEIGLLLENQLCVPINRDSYNPIRLLSHDYPIDDKAETDSYYRFMENKDRHYNGYQARVKYLMTQQKGLKAIEYQEILYFPEAHILNFREAMELDSLVEISKYDILGKTAQIPLCITVMSHNNIPNDRYAKVMKSILQQTYSNYHIVFIDDNSDDQNYQQTINFMNHYNKKEVKVDYVRNKSRKFATYNIIHAAFMFCQKDEVQVLVDGDDELIGRHVFNNFNIQYRQGNRPWVAYHNYMSSHYSYGESQPLLNQLTPSYFNKRKSKDGKGTRVVGHFVGPTRSWYVGLIRSIPLAYHQDLSHKWIETLYDDALQSCMIELSGTSQRFSYLPKIDYLYNRLYGDNDDSTPEKLAYRAQIRKQMMSYHPLRPLQAQMDTIIAQQETPSMKEIRELFEREKQTEFQIYSCQTD